MGVSCRGAHGSALVSDSTPQGSLHEGKGPQKSAASNLTWHLPWIHFFEVIITFSGYHFLAWPQCPPARIFHSSSSIYTDQSSSYNQDTVYLTSNSTYSEKYFINARKKWKKKNCHHVLHFNAAHTIWHVVRT